MKVKPIGVIHSPFKTKKQTPILACKSRAVGRVEVYRKYQDGLKDIEGFSHLILIYRFHKSRGYKLRVKPFLDDTLRGLFSTRYPRRPNQIGITVVRLLNRRRDVLTVRGIDIIDNTPLLDIKPYVPEFAAGTRVRIGWLKGKL
jgi:tRNA-Thr(GGU) m(6)t(6)A37 methyltransferase TsaA